MLSMIKSTGDLNESLVMQQVMESPTIKKNSKEDFPSYRQQYSGGSAMKVKHSKRPGSLDMNSEAFTATSKTPGKLAPDKQ